MARSKPKRSEKTTQGKENKKPKEQPRPGFALVLYTSSQTDSICKGVVNSLEVPEGLGLGQPCRVPDPLDIRDPEAEEIKLHPAVLLKFGHDIEYLYSLHVTKEGKIVPEAMPDQLVPQRNKSEQALRERNGKDEERAKLNMETENLIPLFPLNQGPEESFRAVSNDSGNEMNDTSKVSSDANEGQFQIQQNNKEVATHQPESQVQQNNETATHQPESRVRQNNEAGGSRSQVTQNDASQIFEPEVRLQELECPLQGLLENATPSNIAFLDRYLNILHNHITQVRSNIKGAGPVAAEVCAPGPSNIEGAGPVAAESSHHNQNPENKWKELECFQKKPDDNKFPLVQNVEVFLPKTDIMSLPAPVPRPPGPVGKGLRKPPKPLCEGYSVFPSELVSILLKLLIPEELLTNITASEIPPIIRLVIRAYINLRLMEGFKMSDTDLTTYINECIRAKRRKRVI